MTSDDLGSAVLERDQMSWTTEEVETLLTRIMREEREEIALWLDASGFSHAAILIRQRAENNDDFLFELESRRDDSG